MTGENKKIPRFDLGNTTTVEGFYKIIPIIIGALGVFPKGFSNSLTEIEVITKDALIQIFSPL